MRKSQLESKPTESKLKKIASVSIDEIEAAIKSLEKNIEKLGNIRERLKQPGDLSLSDLSPTSKAVIPPRAITNNSLIRNFRTEFMLSAQHERFIKKLTALTVKLEQQKNPVKTASRSENNTLYVPQGYIVGLKSDAETGPQKLAHLATDGLNPCVGLSITERHDSPSKVAALGHLDSVYHAALKPAIRDEILQQEAERLEKSIELLAEELTALKAGTLEKLNAIVYSTGATKPDTFLEDTVEKSTKKFFPSAEISKGKVDPLHGSIVVDVARGHSRVLDKPVADMTPQEAMEQLEKKLSTQPDSGFHIHTNTPESAETALSKSTLPKETRSRHSPRLFKLAANAGGGGGSSEQATSRFHAKP